MERLLLGTVLDKRVSGGAFAIGYSVGQESVRWKVCYWVQCWTRECQVEGLLLVTVLDKRVSGGSSAVGCSVGQYSVRWKFCYRIQCWTRECQVEGLLFGTVLDNRVSGFLWCTVLDNREVEGLLPDTHSVGSRVSGEWLTTGYIVFDNIISHEWITTGNTDSFVEQ